MSFHDPRKTSRRARQTFGAALMSDTKWRKLLGAIEGAGLGITQMLLKFIDVDEPKVMHFPPSLNAPYAYMDTIEFGPIELRAIEWLELPVNVEPVISPLGRFPVEMGQTGSRILGYRR